MPQNTTPQQNPTNDSDDIDPLSGEDENFLFKRDIETLWHFTSTVEHGIPNASSQRIPFVFRAHPRGNSTSTVQCTVIRSGSFMSSSNFEVWLADPWRLLMVAQKINGSYHIFDVAGTNRSVTTAELAALTKASLHYVGRLRSISSSEYILCTDEVEMLAVKYDQERGFSTPRRAAVCIPAELDLNLVPVANSVAATAAPSSSSSIFFGASANNQLAENSLLRALRADGTVPPTAMRLATREPTQTNGLYRLTFTGNRVTMVFFCLHCCLLA